LLLAPQDIVNLLIIEDSIADCSSQRNAACQIRVRLEARYADIGLPDFIVWRSLRQRLPGWNENGLIIDPCNPRACISDVNEIKINFERSIETPSSLIREPDMLHANLRTVRGDKLFIAQFDGRLGDGNGAFQLNALPTKNDQLKEPYQGERAGKLYQPPIGFVFILSLFAVGFGFLGSLWGWNNFYNGRRLLGTTLIGCGGLLGGFGFFAWWSLTL